MIQYSRVLELVRAQRSYELKDLNSRPQDFKNANFHRDAVAWSELAELSFRRADNIIVLRQVNGYDMYGVNHTAGLRIKCGCRWFTVPQARKHWRGRYNRAEIRAGVELIVKIAKSRKWRILPRP